jgi:hypothetical protein
MKINKKIVYKIAGLIFLIIFFSLIFYNYYSSKTNWNINCEDEEVSFTDMLYFSTVTTFTVGYGDITPKNEILKYLVMFKIVLSSIIVIY